MVVARGCIAGLICGGVGRDGEGWSFCGAVVGSGSFVRDFWNWMERAAIISSSCFLSRSSIDSNVLFM